jgi:lipid A ethanolaminephosphotransferase
MINIIKILKNEKKINFFKIIIFYSFFINLFLILGTRFLLKPFIIIALLISTTVLYYKNVYGVTVHEEIILSAIDSVTEKNFNEINDLLTFKLLYLIILLTIIPSIPLFFIKVDYPFLLKEYAIRLFSILIMLAIFVGMAVLDYKNVSLTARSLKKLNRDSVPHYSISSAINIVKDQFRSKMVYSTIDNNPKLINKDQEIIGIVVVGETARADRFSLNGYSKKTNPLLEKQKIINYKEAYACGTLTKISVPCMFYLDKFNQFSQKKARYQQNAMDIINEAGVNTLWLENNSSCKNVCERIRRIDIITEKKDTDDNILVKIVDGLLINKNKPLQEIDKKISLGRSSNNKHYKDFQASNKKRSLIVLHVMGSHGPKYYKRYPAEFDQFQPSCKSNNPQECSQEELSNAFDNTILYTDYIIDKLIKILQKQNKESFLIYASDHGESLGENGIYLHGVPVAFAPKEQVHIPWLIWYSDKYKKNNKITFKNPSEKITHEFFSHTIMQSLKIDSKTLKKNKSLIQLN